MNEIGEDEKHTEILDADLMWWCAHTAIVLMGGYIPSGKHLSSMYQKSFKMF